LARCRTPPRSTATTTSTSPTSTATACSSTCGRSSDRTTEEVCSDGKRLWLKERLKEKYDDEGGEYLWLTEKFGVDGEGLRNWLRFGHPMRLGGEQERLREDLVGAVLACA